MIVVILALITLPGTLYLLFISISAFLPMRQNRVTQTICCKLAVVIPAHNEQLLILRTLKSFEHQEGDFDLIVVADNCTDKTAEIALAQGARVLIRNEPDKRGKNYALDFAFSTLLQEKYDAFLIIDADTIVEDNLIEEVQKAFSRGAKAVQTRYEVLNAYDSWRTRLLRIAFLGFNYLRPKARQWWGLSAGIFGNGFGLMREVLIHVPFRLHSVAEDLSYHLQLVEAGYKVEFLSGTRVLGEMPSTRTGVLTQRLRWEGGRWQEMKAAVPKLVKLIYHGRYDLIEPLFELLLFPLSYHVVLLFVLLLLATSFLQIYAWISLGIVGFYVVVSLALGGASLADFAALAFAPFYILWKMIMIVPRFIMQKGPMKWIRTDRDNDKSE